MAIRELGTRNLVVGANPVVYRNLRFDQTKAYCIFYEFTIDNPNNIFSYVHLKAQIRNTPYPLFFGDKPPNLEIELGTHSFFYPLSTLYGSDGRLRFYAERLSYYRGGAEADSEVSLRLFYDDEVETASWRE